VQQCYQNFDFPTIKLELDPAVKDEIEECERKGLDYNAQTINEKISADDAKKMSIKVTADKWNSELSKISKIRGDPQFLSIEHDIN
jgi:hypothetical protein